MEVFRVTLSRVHTSAKAQRSPFIQSSLNQYQIGQVLSHGRNVGPVSVSTSLHLPLELNQI